MIEKLVKVFLPKMFSHVKSGALIDFILFWFYRGRISAVPRMTFQNRTNSKLLRPSLNSV